MRIKKGLYLIVDPSMESSFLLSQLEKAVREPVSLVQIWDNFPEHEDRIQFVKSVVQLCQPQHIPVVINNQWELLKITSLAGVHFDVVPANISAIRSAIARKFIVGITCNNDLSILHWADNHGCDYVSFCSMFPSATANSCELVSFDTIRQARGMTALPIFLAGGINAQRLDLLAKLDYSGVAVLSGVMHAENPAEEIKKYNDKILT